MMTALPVIFVQLTCLGDQRVASSSSRLVTCAERATKLSFLSIPTCAASGNNVQPLKRCFEMLKHTIQKSDAMLYAPSIDDIPENCTSMALKCYMLEFQMVLDEEEVNDAKATCIFAYNKIPRPDTVGCPPCEKYSLKNITIFLDRLNTLLEKMNAQGKM
ncbi:uncharacterized protein LOC108893105 isoform X2 [Lates calcarifer]|uniref:Interleukin n=1 Tax=Lates calcarifer TaxID=8187 RepID=A0AAJ7VCD7_LATCA|nr:uncharacterized protein LOC108893105 isoform X2 [Lates calcarifer]